MTKAVLDSKHVKRLGGRHESIISNFKDLKIPDLTILIPVYNEEKTIRSIIQTVRKIESSLNLVFEIIIINDGSTDRTFKEVKKSGERVINIKKNSGKSNALQLGFKESSGSNIITIDADGSHQRNAIKKIIVEYFNSDVHMLIGSRFLKSNNVRFTSPMNVVGNKIFKYILFMISGKYITDSQSGLRIINRVIIQTLDFKSKGYEIESELTAKSLGRGFKVSEIPIDCIPRIYGSSNLNTFIDGVKIITTIIKSYFDGKKQINNPKTKY